MHDERLDGGRVTLPAMTIFSQAAGALIDHYQVWFDVTPLYAPLDD